VHEAVFGVFVDDNERFVLDFRGLYVKSCPTLRNGPPQRLSTMWPVQTLTLLLCLTDEEQLFAQNIVQDKELPAIEVVAPEEDVCDGNEAVVFPVG
jgi:hypothetical protein